MKEGGHRLVLSSVTSSFNQSVNSKSAWQNAAGYYADIWWLHLLCPITAVSEVPLGQHLLTI